MVRQGPWPRWGSRYSVWGEKSGTPRMLCGGPGRAGRGGTGIEPSHSHEWEGSEDYGRARVRKHGRTLGANLRPSHSIMADKVWLELAIQRVQDFQLLTIYRQLKLLELFFVLP